MSEKFDYDSTSNIIQLDDIVLEYGPGDTLQRQGDTQYLYDANGRLIKKIEDCDSAEPKVWLYEWDAEDQLRSVTTPTGDVWEYKYDALGRRIVKECPEKTTRFIWDRNVVVHEVENEVVNSSWVFEPGSFSPQCKVQNNQLYSVICDHLATPRELVDSEGNIVWSVSYSAWGKIEPFKSDKIDCPILFQGQWFDQESGLYYTRARYYEPQCGRFISPDPIGLLGNLNIYLYVINPIMWVDPFGLASSYLFRGDDNYSGGSVGKPLGSSADITTPWDHVRKESNKTSIFTSFATTRKSTKKFSSGNNTSKVSLSDINNLQKEGVIKVYGPDDVAKMMKNHPDKRVRKDANNVKQIMKKNNEVLIEGEIPESVIKCGK